MIRYALFRSCLSRYFTTDPRSSLRNFDQQVFDRFYQRRLERFAGDREQLIAHLRTRAESLLKTSSAIQYLKHCNTRTTTNQFSKTLSTDELIHLLFFAYQHQVKLDLLTKRLIECVSSADTTLASSSFVELLHLLVLHQQKHYDSQTKLPNRTLTDFLHRLQSHLTEEQITQLSIVELSLLSTAMYRLQIPLSNDRLLHQIGQHLIADENSKCLSAVDKQNLIKILTLSNYRRAEIADALANRFNQSFEEKHHHANLQSFSYEIVRMTMRIGHYFSLMRFYSPGFFANCMKLIESEAKSVTLSYRAKDIIQIMNTLITLGYVRRIDSTYLHLIDSYQQMKQFDQKPERLVDLLMPLAMIGYFPETFLEQLFTAENLTRLTDSRSKEKLFFIAQSYKVLCSPEKPLLDQRYLETLPHHLLGSWAIEKRRRPDFTVIMQRLLDCVPNQRYVQSAFLLKHFKSPDIVIHLNAQQQPQMISNPTKRGVSYVDEEKEQCSMYALEVLSDDEVCSNEPCRPLGLFYSKARQLQKLNYIPVMIYSNDSLDQCKTAEEVFQWIVHRARTTEALLDEH